MKRMMVMVVIVAVLVVQIRIQPQKTGKTHQKNQMEIGKPFATLVQPNDRMLQISEQRTVFSLFTDSTIQKLCQKKCH